VKLAPELAPGVSVLPTCQPASIFVLRSLAVRQSRFSMAGSSASAATEIIVPAIAARGLGGLLFLRNRLLRWGRYSLDHRAASAPSKAAAASA
jgi:hypothetical protein